MTILINGSIKAELEGLLFFIIMVHSALINVISPMMQTRREHQLESGVSDIVRLSEYLVLMGFAYMHRRVCTVQRCINTWTWGVTGDRDTTRDAPR